MSLGWYRTSDDLRQTNWTCGYCGKGVGGSVGFKREDPFDSSRAIYICPYCENPTAFVLEHDGIGQYPGPAKGRDVMALPKDVAVLYGEIRRCMQYCAYTPAVLACRKILMSLAVDKGADEGMRFVEYVGYLVENHYAPPGGDEWLERIRSLGNEAAHEIRSMAEDEAQLLLDFCEMLLVFNYEFPARLAADRD